MFLYVTSPNTECSANAVQSREEPQMVQRCTFLLAGSGNPHALLKRDSKLPWLAVSNRAHTHIFAIRPHEVPNAVGQILPIGLKIVFHNLNERRIF